MADNAKSLNELKKLRAKFNWKDTEERQRFLFKFYDLIDDWEGQRPNFRDIFRPEEIDCLLEEGMSIHLDPEPFIDLLIETGYKDEPDVDQDGKPHLPRRTAVHATRGRYPEWERITRKLFKIYDRFDVKYTNDCGDTHLHVACEYGLVKVVEKFLELGQDPNLFENCDGESPLTLAVRSGHKDVALSLLRNGVDPNFANKEGSTILHFLCDGYYGVQPVKMLFEICDESNQPLQVDAKDKFGRTLFNGPWRDSCRKSSRYSWIVALICPASFSHL
ncbi:unnamed protein product [Trichogramma brassicae]|uniref:Ankyrin repeat domain-containing protein 54 n=1 Tax=Trichogramma brassicae TaxID=86971 RepID=A0A6H5IYS2_9HYME|nr:unnamed protein product [Trichogramma brassicae]